MSVETCRDCGWATCLHDQHGCPRPRVFFWGHDDDLLGKVEAARPITGAHASPNYFGDPGTGVGLHVVDGRWYIAMVWDGGLRAVAEIDPVDITRWIAAGALDDQPALQRLAAAEYEAARAAIDLKGDA